MTTNINWNYARSAFSQFFFCKEELVDLIAVYPVLELSLFGKSNQYISEKLDLPEEDVICILQEFLSFSGFLQNLDFSPVILAEKNRDFEDFQCAMEFAGFYVDSVNESVYYGCKRLKEIKREIDKFYAKQ